MLIISVIFQPILFFRISLIRNNGAAEIECIHILIQHYFRRIDILQSFKSILRSKRFHQCSNLSRNVVEASFYSFQLGGLNKRLVTLNVDYPYAAITRGFCACKSWSNFRFSTFNERLRGNKMWVPIHLSRDFGPLLQGVFEKNLRNNFLIFLIAAVMLRWKKKNGHYHRSSKGGGEWEFFHLPEQWEINYKDLTFRLKPFSFKHTGLFPEQATNWDWFGDLIRRANRPIKVLNLFAYTGGATLAAAAAGASVTHVDASKGMVNWAKENAAVSGLSDKPIRWLVDDCTKFVERDAVAGTLRFITGGILRIGESRQQRDEDIKK